jgi:hypothetical protein
MAALQDAFCKIIVVRTKTPAKDKTQVLCAENLSRLKWLRHGFSTRRGGVSKAYGGGALNLGITPEDTRDVVERNRASFLKAIAACGDGTEHVARVSDPRTRVEDPGHTDHRRPFPFASRESCRRDAT